MSEQVLVLGLGVAGEAAARRLAEHGWSVVVAEDRPSEASRARSAGLAGLGVRVVDAPSAVELEALVDGSDLVVPSPGVPEAHPATRRALARGTTVWTELELAARWSEVPVVAITGTNGKTTVTTLVEAMLRASGLATVAAGNTDLPLVDALDLGLDVIVVEASSFRLQFTETFSPVVGTWLNLAEDHLDWHPDLDAYGDAKARVWAAQGPDDVAVANLEDPLVMARTGGLASRLVTFGLDGGDWRVDGDRLVGPDGAVAEVGELTRALPHDLANALAATATATAGGATLQGVRAALLGFTGLPHRMALVADVGGVRWYDDSKATTPSAVVAGLAGFESAVLVAGGRNKGLDLAPLAAEAGRLRAVVAIGEAAADVAAVFDETGVAVVVAATMAEAVDHAGDLARPGDAVLLSPACASFDRYRNYGERGDDFARLVRARSDVASA